MKQEINQHQHPSERLTRKRNPDTEEFAQFTESELAVFIRKR